MALTRIFSIQNRSKPFKKIRVNATYDLFGYHELRPRRDKRGVDLIGDSLPFGRLWYAEPNAISNAIGYAKFYSRSNDAVIRVYDEAGNVIETHESATQAVSSVAIPLLPLPLTRESR